MNEPADRDYVETPLGFGVEGRLAGVLTQAVKPAASPVPGENSESRFGVLLVNADSDERAGLHRFHVKLARSLARQGLPVLRFDVGGVGDSTAPVAQASEPAQRIDELRRAIDLLQAATQVTQVVVVGIASAANLGWLAALTEPRIAALVMIDGHAYPTRRTIARHWLHRWQVRGPGQMLGDATSTIGRSVGQIVSRWLGRPTAPSGFAGGLVDRHLGAPPLDSYVQHMQRLVDRGVSMLLVYTSGCSRHYNYPQQFDDQFGAFPFAARVACDYAPQFDPALTLVAMQRRLIRRIESWLGLVIVEHALASADRFPPATTVNSGESIRSSDRLSVNESVR